MDQVALIIVKFMYGLCGDHVLSIYIYIYLYIYLVTMQSVNYKISEKS
jgi:hypothetical protein